MQDEHETPVIFRKDKSGGITAVFPTLPGTDDPATMTCYAHIGQHSACSRAWYDTTKLASRREYEVLKAELVRCGYKLKVYKKMLQRFSKERKRELLRHDPRVSALFKEAPA